MDSGHQFSRELKELETQMLQAHSLEDVATLVALYKGAGDINEQLGEIDAACFYFTHAYVFALESGDPMSGELLDKLVQYGRDAYPGKQ